MTLRIRELAGSDEGFDGVRDAETTRVARVYDDSGVEPSIATMRSAILAEWGLTYGDLVLDRLEREYDEDGRSWIWTANYKFEIAESTLTWGFDTQGGTVQITYAATNKYPTAAPNMNGGIGFSGGEFQGVEKVIPALKLNARYRWPADTVSTSYINALSAMTGTINAATWQGYAAGELLFLGASGEVVPGKPTEVDYHFAASPNDTLTLGAISGIVKRGHDYLWLLWEDDEDATAKRLTKSLLGAYVAKIYSESSFVSLGIGS